MGEQSQPSFNLLTQGGDCEVERSVACDEEAQDILAELENEDSSEDEDNDSTDEWLPLDEDLLSEALSGGVERSKPVNDWARRRFDSWRQRFKYDLSIPVEKLPLRQLNDMLAKFIMMVKKKNGEIYPPGTLNSIYRGIGRIVRREQEKRIGETGVREPPFDILTDPIFCQSREAFVAVVKRTRKSGNYKRAKKKAPVISFSVERDILDDIDHQITHPTGCVKRLVYYMLTRFGIRAVKELRAVQDCDLTFETNDGGELVKYGERISKNNNPTATKFEDSHFRQPIWTYERDFVLTCKQYFRHLPAKERDSEPRSLFLQPIPKSRTNVWYAVTPVGVNSLGKWLKVMATIVSPQTEICNKSGRVSLVTRLVAADAPSQAGMRITGHRSLQAYEKYDRVQDCKVNACMDIISKPSGTTSYKDALAEQLAKNKDVAESSKNLHNTAINVDMKEHSSTVIRASDLGFVNENTIADDNVSKKDVMKCSRTSLGEISVNLPVIKHFPQAADLNFGKKNAVQSPILETSAPIVCIGQGSVSRVNVPPLETNIDSGKAVEMCDDDYDDQFYHELSKKHPDSARAIGKFMAPVINNQGSFTNCTFNFGLDVAELATAITSAMNSSRQSISQ